MGLNGKEGSKAAARHAERLMSAHCGSSKADRLLPAIECLFSFTPSSSFTHHRR